MGISVWRGNLNKSSGNVLYDKTAGTGTVELMIELASVDFGMDALVTWARGKGIRHPMLKRDCCGADASGSFYRDDFGLGVGKKYGASR